MYLSQTNINDTSKMTPFYPCSNYLHDLLLHGILADEAVNEDSVALADTMCTTECLRKNTRPIVVITSGTQLALHLYTKL